MPSEKSFGFLFALLSLVGFVFFLLRDDLLWTITSGAAAFLFGIAAMFRPVLLKPLNIVWFYFGRLLGKITQPIVLGVLYWLLITPIALTTKAFGRDAMSLSYRGKTSNWIRREGHELTGESLRRQY